jgi:hypothetical protein
MLSLVLTLAMSAAPYERQQTATPAPATQQDTTKKRKAVTISIGPSMRDKDWRRPVTPELLADAYSSARARELVRAARAARIAQDSSIVRYDAMSRYRTSVYLRASDFGRDHLISREDKVARIQWERGVGARIHLIGAREFIPFQGTEEASADTNDQPPIPYYPGREPLILGAGIARSEMREKDDLIHPLVNGAEAYYRYQLGDSLTLRLGEGRTIQLIELQIRPRLPIWNLVVGSIWLDSKSMQVVRAAYKLATPISLASVEVQGGGAAMFLTKAMLNPIKGSIDAVTAEYGLHNGRFWLPATEILEGSGQISFMHMRLKVEQSYTYTDVNGSEPVAPFKVADADTMSSSDEHDAHDTAKSDSTRRARARQRRAVRDSLRAARKDDCRNGAETVSIARQFNNTLPVYYAIPCDTAALAHAKELPPVFATAEDVFGMKQRDEMMAALRTVTQVPIAPGAIHLRYGLGEGLTRYNRVEGLSVGIAADEELGGGLSASALARIGVADRSPNAEISVRRESGTRTTLVAAYRRLAVANDWGTPLGFGASLSALLFGRDDGFYYRTIGAEVQRTHTGATPLTVRLFAEHQSNANAKTNFSVAHIFGGDDFRPNILASTEDLGGVGLRVTHTFGYNPAGFRLLLEGRGEAALARPQGSGAGRRSDSYGRAALDLTASRSLFDKLAAAVTAGGGTGTDRLPPQRLFYLGGPRSIRGLDAGTGFGNTYWMLNGELGTAKGAARPVIFADVGWAGDRSAWRDPGRPLTGAGIGLSILDGIFRIDLAKGIHPAQPWRANLYLEARW